MQSFLELMLGTMGVIEFCIATSSQLTSYEYDEVHGEVPATELTTQSY